MDWKEKRALEKGRPVPEPSAEEKETFMREALKEAEAALKLGEVPIGAVLVRDGEVVGRGHNLRETGKNALYHAELLAIDEACKALGGWRLWDCDLYVTLEPCPMCAGAISNARVRRVYCGAADPKSGTGLYRPSVTNGVLEEDCQSLLTTFFEELRANRPSETE